MDGVHIIFRTHHCRAGIGLVEIDLVEFHTRVHIVHDHRTGFLAVVVQGLEVKVV
jgi:hypothetical protein